MSGLTARASSVLLLGCGEESVGFFPAARLGPVQEHIAPLIEGVRHIGLDGERSLVLLLGCREELLRFLACHRLRSIQEQIAPVQEDLRHRLV